MAIIWPDRYAPDCTAVQVGNQVAINASPAVVWAWLIRAKLWPDWYPNSRDVEIDGGARELSLGVSFRWRTFGAPVRSTVREFVPSERIAWDGTGILIDVYHAWLIEPRHDGCWILTEENQNGLAARAQALLMPNRMHAGHDLWLARLKERAEGGLPPEHGIRQSV